jgi:hypothetical protein
LVTRTVAAYRRADSEYKKTASGWDCEQSRQGLVNFFPSIINHEINPVTVREVCADIGMHAATRAPCWMRRGYVEELFQIQI